ncbi:glycosyltransferase [Paramicrobacterium chengjingii]|uniref:Glycosyltransferase n=1 Tax=Paramicrobacterium chengjingii TaxID=2769067 RepID=A0ABX6YFB9_9MICO|nr:glycosyltransferase [Microbacterium chengjingii]QPZ37478.1 glycosyltransferase [Microbacterium chengjingii]
MTRVLHVSDYETGGGAESVFQDTIASSRALGHRVETLTANGRRNALSYVWSWKSYNRMQQVLRQFKPDIVHLHNYYHALSPSILQALRQHRKSHGVKVVYTAHDYHLVSPNSGLQIFRHDKPRNVTPSSPVLRNLWRFDSRSPLYSALKVTQWLIAYKFLRLDHVLDLIVAPSEFMRSVLEEFQVPTGVTVIRNPVPSSDAALQDRQTTQSSDPHLNSVTYFGRIEPEKGVLDALRILLENGIGVDVFGAGSDTNKVMELCETYASSCRYFGPVKRSELFARLSSYNVLIYPSQWLENAPLAIIEGALHGLRIVAPNIGGCAEMARLTSGYNLYDPESAGSLLRAVSAALEQTEENQVLDPDRFLLSTYRHDLSETYSIVQSAGTHRDVR